MADKKFNITFDVNANINPIKGTLGELKGSLNNLKIPDTFKKSIQSTVDTLEKEITNFESIASKGFSNLGDFNKANRSFEKITNLFNKLGIQVKNLKGIDPNKFLPSETLKKTQSLQQAWLKLKQTIDKGAGNTAAIEKQNKALTEQQQKVKDLEASYNKLQQENISMGSTKGNLTNSLKADKQAADELVKKMKELENVKGGKSSAEYKQMSSELSQLNSTMERTQKQYDDLDAKINKNKASMSGLKIEIDAAKEKTNSITEEIKKLTEAASKTPEELTDLRQKLADLKGVDINEIPEDIDKLGEEISSLNTSQLEEFKKQIQGVAESTENTNQPIKDFADNMHTVGDEVNYASDKAKELEQLANQVKYFFSIGNTVQLFKRAIRSAFDTIKELDAVMTQTAVVTDFSVGDMWSQLPEYTKRANELGVSVKGAYEAATLYYQQGLDTNQVIGVSNETLKMAKIAAIDYATATDYMTSALRGFNMEVNEASARQINDIYSQLAAKTAADTEEISIAMSKTAPLAHNAGMEIQTTAAFLAQAIETTREAPETIGTAMKTVIARFQELKKDPALIEPVEGEIIDANKVEGALRTIGVALRDTSGQFRDLDDVFLEISQKWNSLDTNTQRYIATIAAGSRQQSRFIAMMANYDRTMELVEMANTSAGASQMQFEKTLDSMQSKLDRLKNAWNEFTMGLANNSIIKAVVDLLTDLLNTINKISSGVSGKNGILKSLVDIGILMGGLKMGKAAFSGFFGWLQGKSKVEGRKAGENLSKGIFSTEWKYEESGLFKGLVSFQKHLKSVSSGELTRTDLFKNWKNNIPIISHLTTAFNNVKEAGKKTWEVLKAIPPQAYAVALGVAAITTTVILLVKAIKDNSIEGRIKKAEEQTKLAQTAAENAKEAYDNLLEGKSKYSDLQATLDNLTYGTTAWKEALVEANGQVLQLLQTYPQLANYVQTGVGGRLQLADEGWDEVIKQQEEGIRRTTNNLLGSQIYRANLENEKSYKDLQKQLGLQLRPEFMDELIDLYKTNPIAFTKDGEGNYRQELLDFLNIEGANYLTKADPAKVIAATDAIGEYISAIQENGIIIETYVNSLIDNNGKLENLDDRAAESVRAAYNKVFGENYNKTIDIEKFKLTSAYGTDASTGYLANLLNEYGLEVTYNTTKNLRTLYTHLANITGKEIDDGILKSDEAMAQAIAQMRFGDEIELSINKIAERLKTDTTGGVKKILNILGREIGDFSFADLDEFRQIFDENGTIDEAAASLGMSTDELEAAIIDMGYAVTDASGTLKADFDRFRQDFFDGTVELGETIQQARVNIVTKLLETGYNEAGIRSLISPERGGRELTAAQQLGLSNFMDRTSFLDSDIARNLWADVLENLRMDSQETAEETLDLINNIDFSNTIDSLLILEEAAKSGTEETKKLAQSILEVSSDQLNIGKAFQNFTMSDEYSKLEESLQDIIKSNGKITSKNIKELAKESNTLSKLLNLDAVNANGLAKALTAIANGKIGFEQIDSAILKALSSTTDFNDELSELNDKFNNFDKGFDTNINVENYQKAFEELQTYIDNGELGNEQFKNLYDFLFGEGAWREAVENDFNGLQEAINTKKALFENDGLAFWGSFIEKISNENIEISGLEFDTEGNITELTLTSQELKQVLIDNMTLTEDEAAAMLGVLETYNPAAAVKLGQNDELKEYEVWLDEIAKGQDKVISTQKLQIWADLTGKTIDEIRDEINSLNGSVKVVDWINDEGIELKGQELVDKIKESLHSDEEDWNIADDLGVTTQTQFSWQDRQVQTIQTIDYEVAIKYAEDNDLTLEQIQSIADENDWQFSGELGIYPDLAGYQAAVDEQNTREAKDLSKKSQEAVDNIDTSTFEGNMADATKNGMVTGGNAAIPQLAAAIANTAFTGNIRLNATVDGEYINGTQINTHGVNNTKSSSNIYRSTNSSKRLTRKASGTDFGGLRHSEIALTGEEGYELAYDSHGAFLLGSNGPEIAKLEKGTVIYPHKFSEKILKGYSKSIFPNYKTGTIPNYLDTPYKWTVSPLNGASVSYAQAASDFESLTNSMKEAAETAEDITEETEKWENNVDWLYNMTQKINNELRIREKLEKQYNRALKTNTGTAEDLRRLTNQEIVSLKKRQDMQKEMIELRKQELHTYMMLNKEMMKYAIIDNWDDMTIHIAWDAINSITDKDEYDRAIDFLNKLEDVQKQIYDLEDDVEDIEDELLELKDRGKEQYRDLEDRVLDALISEQQEIIDEQEKTTKAISDAEKDLVDAIQKNIEKMRQDRQNEETETSIAERERRLAYLRQDTTGSNALEIRQLEKELEQEKQDYTDTLIDQAISDMKEQADKASKQREQQIELLQDQLEWQEKTGYFADEATRIVREGINSNDLYNTEMYRLLEKADGVGAMSNASQEWWKEELEKTVKEAYIYLNNVLEQKNGADVVESMKQNSESWMTASSSEQSNLHAENERLAKEYEAVTGEKLTYQNGAWYKENGQRLYSLTEDEVGRTIVSKMKENSAAWVSADANTRKNLEAENEELARRLKSVTGKNIEKKNGVWYIDGQELYKKYERGGLADFTGPAWLDGSKSKPEMVLNAKDTQNFIQLKDILAELRSGIVGNNQEQSGDWYFDIDINVDEIANDYDVDKVADRIKQTIYKETTYRNVNAINFLK